MTGSSLRIVHCFRSPVGGVFRHVRDLCDAQVAAGHEVGIVCDSTTGGAYEDRLIAEMAGKLALGLRRTPMPRHVGLGDLVAGRRTLNVLGGMKPDILHGHGAKGGAYARAFGMLMRLSGRHVGRLYSPHGGSLHYDARSLSGRFFFQAEHLMERLTDHILFVSDFERRTYTLKVGAPRAANSLVYNGLRAEEFRAVAPAAGAADFLFIGMMRDLKGPDIFIDALARTGDRLGRPVSAVMVGEGDDLPRYVAQAAALGLSDHVRFEPAMAARSAFARARIVVVPSRAEAMPYIVLEALAAGRPMIATSVGGIPEIFGAGSRALVQPDADDLGARMELALGDQAAFATAMPTTDELEARFGVEAMARDVEAAYRSVLAREGNSHAGARES